MNQASLPLPDSKAANSREIAKNRNVSASSASKKNKVVSKGVASKADDKLGARNQ